MQHLLRKLSVGVVASGTAIALSAAPLFAVAQIDGNGAFSVNSITENTIHSNVLSQTNDATVTTIVDTTNNSGGNDVSFNTGGDSVVQSGATGTAIQIGTAVNSNAAAFAGSMGGSSSSDVLIAGNGAGSFSDVTQNMVHSNQLFQDNDADIYTGVFSESNTGDNTAGYNTGGDSVILGGASFTEIGIMTHANKNKAVMGGSGHTAAQSQNADVLVAGNGAFSDNSVFSSMVHDSVLVQENDATITTIADVLSNTGFNNADFNTGGDSVVRSGLSDTFVGVDTQANKNFAALGSDGAVLHSVPWITGNGAQSFNDVTQETVHTDEFFQNNTSDLYSSVLASNDSGFNSAAYNTAGLLESGDSTVWSGAALTETAVGTHANSNVLASGMTLPGGWSVDWGWDMGALSSWFGW